MRNIAFCGKIAAGKTYIAQACSKKYSGRVESIATPLKTFGQEILDSIKDGLLDNYKKIKKPEHRHFLALIGNRLRDPIFNHPRFWINKINLKGNESVFVDDMRYDSEEHFLRAKGFLIVRLDASDDIQEQRAIQRDGGFDPSIRFHYSETAYLKINPDITINVNEKTSDQILQEIENRLTISVKIKSFLLTIWYSLVLQIKGI